MSSSLGQLGVDPRVVRVKLSEDEIAAADAVVLLVDHEDFDLELVADHARYILDTQNCMTGTNIDRL
jgi:UDP-N-acetyl-D-glucosamine dehydrogenase